MTPAQMQWLTWGAIQHRPAGAPKWDEPGTAKAIADHCGSWGLAVATEHVLAHARDPKAKTPFVIKGPAPHTEPTKGARFPAKAGEDCPRHPGEYVGSCRLCRVDHLAADTDPILDDDLTAGRALREQIRAARRALEPSPAPGVGASVSAVDDAAAHLGREPQDVQQRAGEPDRPEVACTADGCYRPTRDGICDRCRAKAIADDTAAANAELVDQLKTQQRQRPAPEPTAPGYYRAADIDHGRVHAAQAQAAEQRREAAERSNT